MHADALLPSRSPLSRLTVISLVLLGAVLLTPASVAAVDWPQWRGPQRDGTIDKAELPDAWPAALERTWQATVGIGHSSPVVADGRLFLHSREGEEEVLRSMEVETGKQLWRTAYPAPYEVHSSARSHGAGPKSTPVIIDDKVCTLGVSGILSCFDAASGRLLWQKSFEGRFARSSPPFGASMSPLEVNGNLIAHIGGHAGGAVIAFDPATGEEKWVLEGEGPGYASPIAIELDGVLQVVTQAHKHIMGVDAVHGKQLWSYPFVTPCNQNVITPIAVGETVIFSSLDKGTFALDIRQEKKEWKAKLLWHNREVAEYMSTPVLVGDRLIGMSHMRRGQFFALDPKTGEVHWKSEGREGENASLVGLGSQVLILTDEGELIVLEAKASAFAPLQEYQVATSPTWAHLVPTQHGLLVKDAETLALWSYEPKGGGSQPGK